MNTFEALKPLYDANPDTRVQIVRGKNADVLFDGAVKDVPFWFAAKYYVYRTDDGSVPVIHVMEMPPTVPVVTVDGTDFAITDNAVHECGTLLYYDPVSDKGYQLVDDGRRVAITSYAAFGDDMHSAREAAQHWMGKARRAWLARAE